MSSEVRRDRWGRYLVVPPDGGKPVGYTRATTVAKSLDDGGGLIPWKATLAVTGAMRRPGLRGRWEALISQHPETGPWYGSEESKKASKKLVEECAEAGGSSDRADIGTALHAIVEQINLGTTPLITQDSTRADLEAYRSTLDANGITFDTSLIECVLALDSYQVAGTADAGRAIVPGLGDLVADLKTGADLKYSWQAIAIQLAIYANADNVYVQGDAPDGSEDRRLPMPAISKEWGLVIHLPAGTARCELHLVDLAAGWEAFKHSMWARAWRGRKDLVKPYGVSIAGAAPAAAPVAAGAAASAPAAPDFDAPASSTASAVSPPAPVEAAAGAAVTASAAAPDFDAPAATDAASTPSASPTAPAADRTDRAAARAALPGTPDEGVDVDDDTFTVLQQRWLALPVPAREWTMRLEADARVEGRAGFRAKERHSVRRFEILRALVLLAENEGTDDELVRALLALAHDSDAPLWPAVTVGHAVGALDHERAAHFAQLVDEFVAGRLAGAVDPDGTFRLLQPAAT